MNDDAIFLTHRVDCIAGKPPPTKNVSIQQITCCLIRGGLPAIVEVQSLIDRLNDRIAGKSPPLQKPRLFT